MSPNSEQEDAPAHIDWQADPESHRRWQLTSALSTTPAQRLAWLEEMLELAHRCGALRERDAELARISVSSETNTFTS
jgi:hypothetical protein